MTTPSRREFLAAAAVSPILLGLQDKAGSRLPMMGAGAFAYEVTHDWGTLPSSIRWGNTHGVVEDAQGHIHVHHTVHATSDSGDSVVVFDADGRFVRSWGAGFRGVAHGFHLRREGRDEFLYLTLTASNPRMSPAPSRQAAVVKTTLAGELVWAIDGPPDFAGYRPGPDGQRPPYNPTNVAIAPNGDVYVGDGYGSYFINHYNSRGEYLRSFGGRGNAAGQLAEPHGLIVDTRGTRPVLVVADRRNSRLQRFTLDGQHIDVVAGFRLPCHFDERNGQVVVPDLHGRVTVIGQDNDVLVHLGDSNAPTWANPLRSGPRDRFIPGQFIQPHGACFDHAGNIFVVEWVEVGRVSKLRRIG